MYIHAVESKIVQYPVYLRHLKTIYPQVSFPREPSDTLLGNFNIFPVQAVSKPSCTVLQRVAETAPVQVNGIWTQQWQVVDLENDELADAQKAVALQTAIVEADASVPSRDAVQKAISNISSLQEAKQFLAKFCDAVYVYVKNKSS